MYIDFINNKLKLNLQAIENVALKRINDMRRHVHGKIARKLKEKRKECNWKKQNVNLY